MAWHERSAQSPRRSAHASCLERGSPDFMSINTLSMVNVKDPLARQIFPNNCSNLPPRPLPQIRLQTREVSPCQRKNSGVLPPSPPSKPPALPQITADSPEHFLVIQLWRRLLLRDILPFLRRVSSNSASSSAGRFFWGGHLHTTISIAMPMRNTIPSRLKKYLPCSSVAKVTLAIPLFSVLGAMCFAPRGMHTCAS